MNSKTETGLNDKLMRDRAILPNHSMAINHPRRIRSQLSSWSGAIRKEPVRKP